MTAWILGATGVAGGVCVLLAFLWRSARANASMWQAEAQRRAGEIADHAKAAAENDARRQAQVENLRAENKTLAEGMAELAKLLRPWSYRSTAPHPRRVGSSLCRAAYGRTRCVCPAT